MMQNPCLLLLLLLLPSSFTVESKELFVIGANVREGQRIALPWKVSISFGGFRFCYGAAISDTLVLTAASCLAIFDKDTTLDVVFADGQCTTSSETIVHPDFDSASLFADLGIIRLAQPFQVFATFPIHLVLNTGSNTSLRLFLWLSPCQERVCRKARQSVLRTSYMPCFVFKFSLPPPALPSTKTSLKVLSACRVWQSVTCFIRICSNTLIFDNDPLPVIRNKGLYLFAD